MSGSEMEGAEWLDTRWERLTKDAARAFVSDVSERSGDAAFLLAGWLFMRARLKAILRDADAWREQISREAGVLPREWIDDAFLPPEGHLEGQRLYGSPYGLGDDGRPTLPLDGALVSPEVFLLAQAQQFALWACMDCPHETGEMIECFPWMAPALIDDATRAANVVADLGGVKQDAAIAPIMRSIGVLV